MANETYLQDVIANVTFHAIAQSALSYSVGQQSFTVQFHNVSTPLSIVQVLCASTTPVLNTLNTVINEEYEPINSQIEYNLTMLFFNGSDDSDLRVMIYVTKLSGDLVNIFITFERTERFKAGPIITYETS